MGDIKQNSFVEIISTQTYQSSPVTLFDHLDCRVFETQEYAQQINVDDLLEFLDACFGLRKYIGQREVSDRNRAHFQ